VLPHFRAIESYRVDAYRGTGGPQYVSDIPALHPIVTAFLEGGAEAGLPRNPAHAGAFGRSHNDLVEPDLQFVFTPASASAEGATGRLQDVPGMTIGVWQCRPQSHGFVRARGADPRQEPAIQPNDLIAPEDRAAAIAGLRLARRLLSTSALAAWSAAETAPGTEQAGDDALLAYARAQGATVYHLCGTCRMGGHGAAVTPELRLRGIKGLRVAGAPVVLNSQLGFAFTYPHRRS
jgi:choline dehydrogenase